MSKYVAGFGEMCRRILKYWNHRDIHGYPGHPIDAATAGGAEDWVPVFISSHLLPSADSGSGAAPAAAAMPGPEEGSG